ncbi:hypothetical protein LCGC14_0611230 [marine sediment metagenome]|uniref:Uncharacterized protein n=1 Tax=marine sediment metagenome TaxID=412755 RepID=A0A0F9TTV7_9ZZZZ
MAFLNVIPRPLYAGNHDVYCGDARFYAGYRGVGVTWSDVSAASTSWNDVAAPSTSWTDV